MFERLGDAFRLIAPDLRGFGESGNPHPAPSDRVGADTYAGDVVALLDALGLQRVAVVGHDVGAHVIQRLAIRFPARLTGLLFFNFPPPRVGAHWREAGHVNQPYYHTFDRTSGLEGK